MKTALCLSGHVRSLKHNIVFYKNIIKDLNCDVFLHSWTTAGWRAQGNEIFLGKNTFKGFDHESEDVNQSEILELLEPKKAVFDVYLDHEEQFFNQAKRYTRLRVPHMDRPIQIVSMAYKIMKCNELKQEQEVENSFKYDVVLRSRPDIVHFQSPITPNIKKLIEDNWLITPNEYCHETATDIFALGNSEIMDRYATLFNVLDEIYDDGCLFNPHNVIEHFFNKWFPNKWLKTNLSIDLNRCRKNCEIPKGCEIYGNVMKDCNFCDPRNKILTEKTTNNEQ